MAKSMASGVVLWVTTSTGTLSGLCCPYWRYLILTPWSQNFRARLRTSPATITPSPLPMPGLLPFVPSSSPLAPWPMNIGTVGVPYEPMISLFADSTYTGTDSGTLYSGLASLRHVTPEFVSSASTMPERCSRA